MSVKANTTPSPDRVAVRRALLSVFDKTGIVELARCLAGLGVELVSTGGTFKALNEAGLAVRDVTELTGFPEIMDGRVKTLHPGVHGGLLGIRDDAAQAKAMATHQLAPIDLLVSNLYPFAETLACGADAATIVENIDIGGPAMIRAGAKNHGYVTVVVDPSDYDAVLAEMTASHGETSLVLRRTLAARAYALTASYDAAVSGWFCRRSPRGDGEADQLCRHAVARTALRREPAPAGRFLHDRRDAAWRFDRAAGPGQGAVLQQHQRHGRGLRARRRVRCGAHGRRRDHQARQSLRRGRRARSRRRLREGAGLRPPSRPSAASSRSTAGWMRQRPRRWSRCSPR